jgi:hypothetical protein
MFLQLDVKSHFSHNGQCLCRKNAYFRQKICTSFILDNVVKSNIEKLFFFLCREKFPAKNMQKKLSNIYYLDMSREILITTKIII